MKADKDARKDVCSTAPKHTGHAHDDNPEKVYLVNTKHLRISSTKNWAKVIDQLRKQIRNGSKINGVLQDHFF